MDNSTALSENVTMTNILSQPVKSNTFLRNRMLGGIGFLINMAAVLMLYQSRRVWPSLRTVLVSQSLSDLVLMTIAAFWRPELSCWPAIYVIASANLVSFFMTVVLAFSNYLAVFFPTRCRQILTARRSLVVVAAGWLGGYLVGLACVGTHVPTIKSDRTCLMIPPLSRSGLIALSCVCFLCCCFIVFLNLLVLIALRRRDQTSVTAVQRITVRPSHSNTETTPLCGPVLSCPRRSSVVLPISNCTQFHSRISEQQSSDLLFCESSNCNIRSLKPITTRNKNTDSFPCTSQINDVSLKSHINQYRSFDGEPGEQEGTFSPSRPELSCTEKKMWSSQMETSGNSGTVRMDHLQVPSRVDLLSQTNQTSARNSCRTHETSDQNQSEILLLSEGAESSGERNMDSFNGAGHVNGSFVGGAVQINEIRDYTHYTDRYPEAPIDTMEYSNTRILTVSHKEWHRHYFHPIEHTGTVTITMDQKAVLYTKTVSNTTLFPSDTPVLHVTPALNATQICHVKPTSNPIPVSNATQISRVTPVSHVKPALNATSVSHSTPVSNDTPVSHVTLAFNTTPVLSDTPVLHVTPAANATLASNAIPVSHPTPVSNATPVSHVTPASKATQISHVTPVSHVKPASNATPASNASPVSRPTSASNATPVSHATPVSNATPVAHATPVSNQRARWRRRTQKTLLILCSWCCFLTLPYVIYGGYVAIWIEDRINFTSSGFGILLSSLAVFNSITNPFLYALRFVEWRAIWDKWRRKIRTSAN